MTKAGHNNPPDPIDEATAPFADAIAEAENWLDGSAVENDGQMKAVDALTKDIKAALKAATDGQKSATAPLHDAWKSEIARWKPTVDDLIRIKNGLVAIVGAFKKKKAAALEEERRAAFAKAEKIRQEAAEKARQAGDIEAAREADALLEQAKEATKEAKSVETVKGLRTVAKFEITSHRDALHWIAKNDRDAVTAFVESYVAKNHRAKPIVGVRSWEEKEAF